MATTILPPGKVHTPSRALATRLACAEAVRIGAALARHVDRMEHSGMLETTHITTRFAIKFAIRLATKRAIALVLVTYESTMPIIIIIIIVVRACHTFHMAAIIGLLLAPVLRVAIASVLRLRRLRRVLGRVLGRLLFRAIDLVLAAP